MNPIIVLSQVEPTAWDGWYFKQSSPDHFVGLTVVEDPNEERNDICLRRTASIGANDIYMGVIRTLPYDIPEVFEMSEPWNISSQVRGLLIASGAREIRHNGNPVGVVLNHVFAGQDEIEISLPPGLSKVDVEIV